MALPCWLTGCFRIHRGDRGQQAYYSRHQKPWLYPSPMVVGAGGRTKAKWNCRQLCRETELFLGLQLQPLSESLGTDLSWNSPPQSWAPSGIHKLLLWSQRSHKPLLSGDSCHITVAVGHLRMGPPISPSCWCPNYIVKTIFFIILKEDYIYLPFNIRLEYITCFR